MREKNHQRQKECERLEKKKIDDNSTNIYNIVIFFGSIIYNEYKDVVCFLFFSLLFFLLSFFGFSTLQCATTTSAIFPDSVLFYSEKKNFLCFHSTRDFSLGRRFHEKLCFSWWLKRNKTNGKIYTFHCFSKALGFSRKKLAQFVWLPTVWGLLSFRTYCGMKNVKNVEENSLNSGSFYPLHFPSHLGFDFPMGHNRISATPQMP